MRRAREVLRAVAASVALALLMVGLPIFLVRAVGWPLPRQVPTLDQIGDTLTGRLPLDTATVWKVLAVVLWLAWAQVVIAVAVEIVATARGVLPRAVPGLAFAHALVAPLVAAVVLAWSASSTTTAAATPALAVAAAEPPPVAHEPPPPPAVSAPATTPAPPPVIEHIVQRRDTLWDLAERYLGDGYRATDIWELNRGRPQPDGGALIDPGLIRPGWVLRIPVPADAAQAPPPGSVTVAPGDTLWDIAEESLGDGHRYVEIVQLNEGRPQPDGGALTDPDVIEPGWTLALPSDIAAEARAPTPPAAPLAAPPPAPAPQEPNPPAPDGPPATMSTTPATVTEPAPPAPSETGDAEPADDTDGDDISLPAVAGLAALGIGAAGAVAALERRRRAQQRRRTHGQRLPSASDAAQAAERLLRVAASPSEPTRLDAALRAAAAGSPAALSALQHVEVRSSDVMLVFAHDFPPAEGFDADRSPKRWKATATTATLDARGAAVAAPVPALMPVGTTADGSEVFIDAEAAGVLFVAGDPAAVSGALRAMATTAATASWVDAPGVVVAGAGSSCAHLGATTVADLTDALDVAERHAHRVRAALDAAHAESVVVARATSVTPEVFAPVLVISTTPATSDELERLRELATVRAGAAVVLPAAEHPPSWGRTITVASDGTTSICEPGPTRIAVLGEEHAALVTELFETAAAPPAASVPPAAPGPPPPSTQAAPPLRLGDLLAGIDVVVRVLGEVTAVRVGATGEEPLVPPKQKSLEALVYLALRDGPVDRDDLQAALWPAGANSVKTFHNAVWGARRMLGTGRDGSDLLPEPTDGRYALSDRIATDYGLFHALVDAASKLDDPTAAAATLEEALGLVRGEPFTGVGRGYAWVAPHSGIIVAEVVDAAEELASMRLAAGDWRGAEWAARQGLKVFPCDERLYRLLMRAAHAAGNATGVQRVFQELLAAVADPDGGVEPEDTVHPETVALLEELTSGPGERATA